MSGERSVVMYGLPPENPWIPDGVQPAGTPFVPQPMVPQFPIAIQPTSLSATDLVIRAKARLAEIETEAKTLRAIIAAAEGAVQR